MSSLIELGNVSRGRSRHRPRNDESLYGGKYPFVQTGDIKNSLLHVQNHTQTYNEKGLQQSKLWSKGTLCITIAANIAETAILSYDACFPDSIVGFTANPDKADVYYIKYYIDYLKLQMQQISKGTTQDNLSVDKLLSFDFFAPSPIQQRKIIAPLLNCDLLIEANNRRIAVLEEMAQKLYREWFVHFRFPGHENIKMVESELGLIPDGWNVERLSDTANIIMGQSPKSSFYNDSGEGLPFHQGVTNFTALIPEHKAYSTGGTRIAEDGDILFSVRAPVGRINIADCKLILGRGVAAIRHKQNHQAFLLFLLKTTFDRPDMIGNGAIFNSVTKSDMSEIKVIVPVSEITLKFDNVANSIVKELITIYHKNTNLRKTRDLLLPRLISGDIDISKLEIPVKEE